MKKGGFTFVLHSHLPYCRKAGRWPHGEEWIHEAAAETYIPLLNSFYDLLEEGVKWKLTIGITPILTEQLADPEVLNNFEEYLQEKIAAADNDIQRFSAEGMAQAQSEAREVARKAAHAAEERAKSERVSSRSGQSSDEQNQELSGAESIRLSDEELNRPYDPSAGMESLGKAPDLRQQAVTEIALKMAGKQIDADLAPLNVPSQVIAITDAESTLNAEVTSEGRGDAPPPGPDPRWGVAQWYREWYKKVYNTFVNRFNRDIVGAFKSLQDQGYIEIITCAATHGYLPLLSRDSTIYGQLAVAVSSYERHFGRKPRAIWLPECAYRPAYYATGEDGNQYYKPGIEEFLVEQGIKLFFSETHTIEGGVPVGKAGLETLIGPYSYVQRRYVIPSAQTLPETNNTTFSPYWVNRPEVSVIGRNNRTGMQVWSAKYGYPGDRDYREFHRKDSGSGLQYWRISGPDVDLGFKDYYNPDWAEMRTEEHSEHFVGLVEQELGAYYDTNGKPGIMACNYDTELFGHWWFEGPEWMKKVLRKLASSVVVDLTTASDWVEQHPPETVLAIPESSWGQQGTHFVWMNEDTEWMWPPIYEAEKRMEKLVELFEGSTSADKTFLLQQTARELLLLESSDWPFLVTTGQARDYAELRFNDHLERFTKLAEALEAVGRQGSVNANILEDARHYNDLDNPFPEIDYRVFAVREGRKPKPL